MKVVISDLETLLEIFLCMCYDPEEKRWYKFEVSREKNELDELIWYIESHTDYYFVFYNGLKFDSQVLEFIIRNHENWNEKSALEICSIIFQFANDTIDDSNYDIFPAYREENLSFKIIDPFEIAGYSNKNRMVSLKRLEFEMDMENIEECPIQFDKKDLTREEAVQVIDYCKNDVWALYNFYLYIVGKVKHPLYKGKNKIADRLIIEQEVGLKCLNWSDVKIGAEWNKLDYMSLTKKKETELRPQSVNHFFGKRYRQFFPKTVSFQTRELKLFIRDLGETFILNKKQEFPYKFSNSLTVNIGRGGLHSQEKPRMLTPTNDEIYWQADFGSQYPNAIRKFKIYPSHLGKEWNDMLTKKIERRLTYKQLYKETKDAKYNSLQEMGKLALNGGAFGRMNMKGDWQEDPCSMLKVTMGCQLEILMIVETLLLKGFDVVSVNTDGFDVIIEKSRNREFKKLCTFYEKKIGNEELGRIEYTQFLWIAQTSVNDYIAMKTDGELKLKGDFTIDYELHKNKSRRIVPIALQAYYRDRIPVEETIRNHTNIYDFCIRQKSSKDFHYEGISNKKKTVYNKLIRYYVSVEGEKILKVKNPECTTRAAKVSQVEAGLWKMTVCNKMGDVNHHLKNINFSYYIEQANKIIYKIASGGKIYKAPDVNQLTLQFE